jgi:hypothetical protein
MTSAKITPKSQDTGHVRNQMVSAQGEFAFDLLRSLGKALPYVAGELHTIGRERLQVETSRRGELPNMRVYSRLNWETLS